MRETPVGNVAHFEDSTGSCYINSTTTSLSCSSDARLKTKVVAIDASSTLAELLALNPVTYNWLTEAAGTPTHGGFIAQQVLPILPDLVSRGPDGYYTLNYAGFTPYLVKAIQQLSAKLDALATAVAGFAEEITTKVLTAGRVKTQELCVGSTCLTEPQLQALLQKESVSAAPSSASSDSPAAASTAGSSSSSALSSATAAEEGATTTEPVLDSAPPPVPDYSATTTMEAATSTAQ
jgi:hypothetical protein